LREANAQRALAAVGPGFRRGDLCSPGEPALTAHPVIPAKASTHRAAAA